MSAKLEGALCQRYTRPELTVDPVSIVLGGGVAQVGEPLRFAVQHALRTQAEGSPFRTSLDLAGRLRMVPADHPVAAVGAALLGR